LHRGSHGVYMGLGLGQMILQGPCIPTLPGLIMTGGGTLVTHGGIVMDIDVQEGTLAGTGSVDEASAQRARRPAKELESRIFR